MSRADVYSALRARGSGCCSMGHGILVKYVYLTILIKYVFLTILIKYVRWWSQFRSPHFAYVGSKRTGHYTGKSNGQIQCSNPVVKSSGQIQWSHPVVKSSGQIQWSNPVVKSSGQIFGQIQWSNPVVKVGPPGRRRSGGTWGRWRGWWSWGVGVCVCVCVCVCVFVVCLCACICVCVCVLVLQALIRTHTHTRSLSHTHRNDERNSLSERGNESGREGWGGSRRER
jgi:hypothetical protein